MKRQAIAVLRQRADKNHSGYVTSDEAKNLIEEDERNNPELVKDKRYHDEELIVACGRDYSINGFLVKALEKALSREDLKAVLKNNPGLVTKINASGADSLDEKKIDSSSKEKIYSVVEKAKIFYDLKGMTIGSGLYFFNRFFNAFKQSDGNYIDGSGEPTDINALISKSAPRPARR